MKKKKMNLMHSVRQPAHGASYPILFSNAEISKNGIEYLFRIYTAGDEANA